MNHELRTFLESLAAQLQNLAHAVDQLAGLEGQEQTAKKAQIVAADVQDAWVDWDSYSAERTI